MGAVTFIVRFLMRTIKVGPVREDVKIDGPATYYLRFYTDGTFDVFAHVDGELVARPLEPSNVC